MEHEQQLKTDIESITARLLFACWKFTEITGRHIYIDVYPVSPHFQEVNEYTHELTEVRNGPRPH